MSRVAWRGVVRVMRPRTMSPTVGRRAGEAVAMPEGWAGWVPTEMVGNVGFLEEEVVDETGPARLACRLEVYMCEPGPGLWVDVGARVSPGSAKVGVDILLVAVVVKNEIWAD